MYASNPPVSSRCFRASGHRLAQNKTADKLAEASRVCGDLLQRTKNQMEKL
jgi:hypothetical protein